MDYCVYLNSGDTYCLWLRIVSVWIKKNVLCVIFLVLCLHAGDVLHGFFSQTLPAAQGHLQLQPIRGGHHFWPTNHCAELGNPGLHQPEQWCDLSMDPWNSMTGCFNSVSILSYNWLQLVWVCLSGPNHDTHQGHDFVAVRSSVCLQISIWTTVKQKLK